MPRIRDAFRVTLVLSVIVPGGAGRAVAADESIPAYRLPTESIPIYTNRAPVAPPFEQHSVVHTWDGFYAGFIAGGGVAGSVPGPLVGGGLGYVWQNQSLVLGGEADINWAKMRASGFPCSSNGVCHAQNSWFGTARFRVGYAIDRVLPYFTGGLAYGDATVTNSATGTTISTVKPGFALGAGVDLALPGAWSARLEYLYINLGSINCSPVCATSSSVIFDSNIFHAGFNYRF